MLTGRMYGQVGSGKENSEVSWQFAWVNGRERDHELDVNGSVLVSEVQMRVQQVCHVGKIEWWYHRRGDQAAKQHSSRCSIGTHLRKMRKHHNDGLEFQHPDNWHGRQL